MAFIDAQSEGPGFYPGRRVGYLGEGHPLVCFPLQGYARQDLDVGVVPLEKPKPLPSTSLPATAKHKRYINAHK